MWTTSLYGRKTEHKNSDLIFPYVNDSRNQLRDSRLDIEQQQIEAQALRNLISDSQDRLKSLRNEVDPGAKGIINNILGQLGPLL